jgi:hypothetical protein
VPAPQVPNSAPQITEAQANIALRIFVFTCCQKLVSYGFVHNITKALGSWCGSSL